MSHSLKVRSVGLLLLAALIIGAFWFSPLSSLLGHKGATTAAHAASLPYHEFANGPYKVQGNAILGADGTHYIFHGVGRDGLEFSCTGDSFMDAGHLAFMGPGASGPGGTFWWSNTVRLPLSEGIWLRGYSAQSCSAAQYQALVKQIVDALTAMKLNVIIDLQWTDAGGQSQGGGAGWQMPDSESVTFWTQVAGIYKSYSNVLFELYNEPHPSSWTIWQQGGTITDTSYEVYCHCTQTFTYKAVGIQALVNAVHGTGATNLALVAGMNWGFDLSQLSSFPITGYTNIVYDSHPYPYPGKEPANWDAAFGNLSATAPVMSAENGEYDCGSTYMSQLFAYFDAHSIGWTAWAWYSVGSPCGYPQLISDYQGTPTANMGTYIYQHLLSYANITPPPPAVGPVSKTWYFAEGRAGGGFNEFLTMGNPTSSACQVNIEYLYTPDGGTAATKTVTVNVPAEQRVTEYVDGDLGTTQTGRGITDSAIITAPSCGGIVAERPMYFTTFGNSLGVNSGDDTLGSTQLGTTFYFGDVAVGGGYSSFLSILNPPGAAAATVIATYYAGGQQVATQQTTVPGGTRGTIFPANASSHMPAHVAVALTSTQPVAIERPTYFSNIGAGNAGVVSGAADILGVQALSNDWLFAEGYTGPGFQENFAIGNLDPGKTPASVTINLEYSNGVKNSYTVTVGPLSQVIWNVNTGEGPNPPTQDVSAEITSTGAKIVVDREMFFHYNHAGNGRTLAATGGSDVIGLLGPAAATAFSFAEGYTNVGYDEWLTIQNPTSNTETLTVTLANAKGTVFTFQIVVDAHSRYTLDVVHTVIQYMYHPSDGYLGYEVSMALQSSSGPFVAERPMYWNASGTQGGDDAIGY